MDVTIIYINENYNINSMNGSKSGSLNTFVFPLKSFIIGIIRNTKRCNTTKIKPLEQYFCAITSNRVELELGDFSNPGRVLELYDSDLMNINPKLQSITLPYFLISLKITLLGDFSTGTTIQKHEYYNNITDDYVIIYDPDSTNKKHLFLQFSENLFPLEKTVITYNDFNEGDLLEVEQIDDRNFYIRHSYGKTLFLDIKLFP